MTNFRTNGLSRLIPIRTRPTHPRARQQGVTLIIALIVLVIMTLAGIQLMRSVDSTNIIAGNLAFQQAAMHSGDRGIEAAVAWLEQQNNASSANLIADHNTLADCKGYTASYTATTEPPAAGATWDTWWDGLSACKKVTPNDPVTGTGVDSSGNTVSYTINRMCSSAGVSNASGCSSSSVTIVIPCQTVGCVPLKFNGAVYYRITSRIDGPRGTLSYVQAVVAM